MTLFFEFGRLRDYDFKGSYREMIGFPPLRRDCENACLSESLIGAAFPPSGPI